MNTGVHHVSSHLEVDPEPQPEEAECNRCDCSTMTKQFIMSTKKTLRFTMKEKKNSRQKVQYPKNTQRRKNNKRNTIGPARILDKKNSHSTTRVNPTTTDKARTSAREVRKKERMKFP